MTVTLKTKNYVMKESNVRWAWAYCNIDGDNSENNLGGDYMITDLLNMKDCDLDEGWWWWCVFQK